MKRIFLLVTFLCALSLACSLPGRGLSPTAPPPSVAAIATFQPTSQAPFSAPTLRLLPTSAASATPTSSPTLIVPTASLDYEFDEEIVEIDPQATPLPPSLVDVTYCTLGGVDLKMDVYFPEDREQVMPAVVYVHGGGWAAGDKRGGPGVADTRAMLQAGFAVFSVNYRLAPEFLFPAMIQDVKCAIRSIRARATEYRIDPERIGAWGGSAGGHLVALLGTSDPDAALDVGEYLDQSSRVQAVVDMFGPADLTIPVTTYEQMQLLTNAFPIDQYVKGSPVTYASPDDPPFLILQGDKDALVPLEQSVALYERLTAQNVPATLVVVRNAGHGFKPVDGIPTPSPSEISQMVLAFLLDHLK